MILQKQFLRHGANLFNKIRSFYLTHWVHESLLFFVYFSYEKLILFLKDSPSFQPIEFCYSSEGIWNCDVNVVDGCARNDPRRRSENILRQIRHWMMLQNMKGKKIVSRLCWCSMKKRKCMLLTPIWYLIERMRTVKQRSTQTKLSSCSVIFLFPFEIVEIQIKVINNINWRFCNSLLLQSNLTSKYQCSLSSLSHTKSIFT